MIISFKHKGLENFFLTGSVAGIQAIHRKRPRSEHIVCAVTWTGSMPFGFKPIGD
jgi:plasmid maintenance system killer protein